MNKFIAITFFILCISNVSAAEVDKHSCILKIGQLYDYIEEQINAVNIQFEKEIASSGIEANLHKYYTKVFDTKSICYFDETIRKHSKTFLQHIKTKRVSEINHINSQNNYDAIACAEHINYLEKEARQFPDIWKSKWQKVISKANKNLLFFSTMEEVNKKLQPTTDASAE